MTVSPFGLRRFGPFLLERELGRGANGVVFLVTREGHPGKFALKVHTGARDRESLIRLQLEAEITARIDHPGIVPVLEQGQIEGRDYLLMEYCAGESLQERLRRVTLSWLEAAEIVLELARTMAAAHEKGILHRDLKPANVILEAATGKPRIIDFGLARDRSLVQSLTQSCIALGTPITMAPEQLLAEQDVDARADVYALGVILYQCLTGRPPFLANDPYELQRQVMEDAPVPPSQCSNGLPPQLERLCLQALSKQRGRRHDNAGVLAADLEAVLDDPNEAPPPRALVWLAAVAVVSTVLVAIAVGVVALWGPPTPAADPVASSVAPAPTSTPSTSSGAVKAEVEQLLAEVSTRLRRRESLAQVMPTINQALRLTGEDVALRDHVRLFRAEAFRRRGDYRSAIEAAPVAAQGQAGFQARFLVGLCWLRLGRNRDSKRVFTSLAKDDPDGGAGLDARAVLMIGQGDRTWAEVAQRAAAANPTELHARIAGAYGLCRVKSARESLAALEKIQKDEPDDPHVFFVLAFVRSMSGDYAGAEAAYSEVLSITAPFASHQALRGRARMLSAQKKFAEALLDIDRLLRIDPGNVGTMLSQGLYLIQIGKRDEAFRTWRKAVELRDPVTWEEELERVPRELARELRKIAKTVPAKPREQ